MAVIAVVVGIPLLWIVAVFCALIDQRVCELENQNAEIAQILKVAR